MRQSLILLLIVFACGLLFLLAGSRQKDAYWHYSLADGLRLHTIALKFEDEARFSRDPAYSDADALRYYTPSYFNTLRLLQADGADYLTATSRLYGITVALTVGSMLLLALLVTGSAAAAVVAALLALVGFTFYNHPWDYWTLETLRYMLPRVLANPWAVLALAAYWQAAHLRQERRFAVEFWWGVGGLMTGAAAYFHPTTGLGLAALMAVLNVAWMLRARRFVPLTLALLAMGTLLLAAPTLRAVTAAPAFDITQDVSVATVNPSLGFVAQRWQFFSVVNSAPLMALLVGAWLICSLALWALNRQGRALAGAAFVCLQVAFLGLYFRELNPALVALLCRFVWAIRHDDLLARCVALAEIIAAVVLVFTLVTATLVVLSLALERDSLYLYATQMSRVLRLANVPLLLLVGCALGWLAAQPRKVTPLHLALAGLVLASLAAQAIYLVGAGMVVCALLANRARLARVPLLTPLGLGLLAAWMTLVVVNLALDIFAVWAIAAAALAGLVVCGLAALGARGATLLLAATLAAGVLFTAASAAGYTLTTAVQNIPQQIAGSALLVPILALLGFGAAAALRGLPASEIPQRRFVQAAAAGLVVQAAFSLFVSAAASPPPALPDVVAAGRWLHANSEKDDLVFLGVNTLAYSIRPLLFRIESERSSTDVSQDFLLAPQAGTALVDQQALTRDIRVSLAQPASLVAMAQRLRTDYIVIDAAVLGYTLSLPPLFEHGDYRIYATPGG
jgi:hypothetical protein